MDEGRKFVNNDEKVFDAFFVEKTREEQMAYLIQLAAEIKDLTGALLLRTRRLERLYTMHRALVLEEECDG